VVIELVHGNSYLAGEIDQCHAGSNYALCAIRVDFDARPSPSSRGWGRSPREIIGPQVDRNGGQAQSDTEPEDRRMMDRSPIARSRFHSITSPV
jgi:hypothetical protein